MVQAPSSHVTRFWSNQKGQRRQWSDTNFKTRPAFNWTKQPQPRPIKILRLAIAAISDKYRQESFGASYTIIRYRSWPASRRPSLLVLDILCSARPTARSPLAALLRPA